MQEEQTMDNTASTQSAPQGAGVLKVGRAFNIPVTRVPSDIRTLSHNQKRLPKENTDQVLKDGDEWVFSDERICPAVAIGKADVESREGMIAAINRLYDSLTLIRDAQYIELPGVDGQPGEVIERKWNVTSDLALPGYADEQGQVSSIDVGGEAINTKVDEIALYILRCLDGGHSLVHQRQMQKQLRERAEQAYVDKFGPWTDDAGKPRKSAKRVY